MTHQRITMCGDCSSLKYTELGLTGTKLGCGEGGCGACTVMVSSLELPTNKKPQRQLAHRAVNACLCPLYAVEGCHIVTVEGEPL
jgi:xanthine dehydrogenase/oxidase